MHTHAYNSLGKIWHNFLQDHRGGIEMVTDIDRFLWEKLSYWGLDKTREKVKKIVTIYRRGLIKIEKPGWEISQHWVNLVDCHIKKNTRIDFAGMG